MAYFWSFSVAGYFLPILLAQQGLDNGGSTDETYRNYIWICESAGGGVDELFDADTVDLPGITATIVAAAVSLLHRFRATVRGRSD